jgi:hypothetical protein
LKGRAGGMVRFGVVMIRSLTIRLLAGLVLLSQTLALLAACGCMPSNAGVNEEPSMAMSSCHEESTGLRVSIRKACCCGGDRRDQGDGVPAASVAQGAAPTSPSLSSLAPFAPSAILTASHTTAMNRRGSSPPRPPLRV